MQLAYASQDKSMELSSLFELAQQGSIVIGALLAILGGLKVLARYTKSQADDRVLEVIEKPLKLIAEVLGKGKK
jgi:hypothetical protein